MESIIRRFRTFFSKEEVEPFNPDADEFVQRMEREQEQSRAAMKHRREYRRDWLDEPVSRRFRGYESMEGEE